MPDVLVVEMKRLVPARELLVRVDLRTSASERALEEADAAVSARRSMQRVGELDDALDKALQVVGYRRRAGPDCQDFDQLVDEIGRPVIGEGPVPKLPFRDIRLDQDIHVAVPLVATDAGH